jgi:eukaryotic-like serine/threonine-protein kinase
VPPEIIANRYRVLRSVGRGGMGEVWLCDDELLGRQVAVKQVGVLPGESVPDLARALREARSSAALNHRHVVSVYDAIETDDHIWLVMEYVPGSTLAELIAQEGRLDPGRVATIGAQVADGLAAAHARGTVHRDVKPGNVLVGDGDVAKISDFGISRTTGEDRLTRSDLVMGTPHYFSPQLARGADPTPADDVWALGATLYAAVEGVPPVEDRGNPIATLAAAAESRPSRPEHAGFLADAIGRMLDPDPVSRWSMGDAAHALERVHDQHRTVGTLPEGVPAAAPGGASPLDAAAPVRRRHRWPLVAAFVVVLLLAAAIVGLLQRRDDDPTASRDQQEPSSSASTEPTPEPTPKPTPTSTATVTETATATASPTESATEPAPAPAPAAGSAEETVAAYYGLLPEDTEAAWEYLGEGARADAGGYDAFAGFWRTISDVSVGGTEVDGDTVTVELVYDGDESETRQLEVTESGDGWIISDDLGPV